MEEEEEKKKPRMGTIAYHKMKIAELSSKARKAQEASLKVRRAKMDKTEYQKGFGNTVKKEPKKPKKRAKASSVVSYDFLKYIRVVFKWAGDTSGLSRPHIEMLLYLYGVGTFTLTQFTAYHRLMGIYPQKSLSSLQEEGWISIWRYGKNGNAKLFQLSTKAKSLCRWMHEYSMGSKPIPQKKYTTLLNGKVEKKRINTYYLDIIKRMSKDLQEKTPRE